MNTHGHEDVANLAGLRLLKDTYGENMRLGAFYLGNWLADLSQIVDPVAASSARGNLKLLIDKILNYVMHNVYMRPGSTLLPTGQLYTSIKDQGPKLHAMIDEFFDLILANRPGGSYYHQFIQPGILLKGYFKFVHPESGGQPRMDIAAYVAVFNTLFTQYWPDEHLDRPYDRNPDPVSSENTQYDRTPGTGKRSPNATERQQYPDLYDYLRDFLEIIAGKLAFLDLNWAPEYLGSSREDTDIGWNVGLARLGHAIHAVEDFFAHSNFIEHAALTQGDAFLPYKFEWINSRRYFKRLRRYTYNNIPEDWTKNPEEEFVVTGYFDFVDTLFSFVHLAESGLLGFLELEPVDVTRYAASVVALDPHPREMVKKADEVVRDLLDILHDPERRRDAENAAAEAFNKALEATPGEDVQALIEALRKGETTPQQMAALVDNMPLFQDIKSLAPPGSPAPTQQAVATILAAFFNFIRIMMVPVRTVQVGRSIYEIYKAILKIRVNPLLWLEKEIEDYAKKKLAEIAIYYAKEAVYNALGMERIGCHSLMSKDHGEEVLYQEMKSCATAVHYTIVKTMLRWRDPSYDSRADNAKWVDWLEMLEYFTAHPAANIVCSLPKDVPVEIIHVPTPEELRRGLDQLMKDLALRYQPVALRPIALPPGQPWALDDKKIIHANCSTKIYRKRTVDLAEDVTVTLLFPQAVAASALRQVIIPYIKHTVKVCDPALVSQRWYVPVMKDGWHVIRTNNPHVLKYHASRDLTVKQVERGDFLRNQWHQFYLEHGIA